MSLPSSNNKFSILSTSDWRKIECLLRQIVVNQGNKQVKRLSQVVYSNSVQNALLKDEVKGLRKALINEKTRRKQGKPLLLEEPGEYHGEAVFWSPRKMKNACE
jgi:hypothetical protein